MSLAIDPAELPELVRGLAPAQPLLERLAGEAAPVYLVGGAVRDLLLGRTPRELDLVVEGDPGPLAARLGRPLAVHARFGTFTVSPGLDLARARAETYPLPGALPDVVPAGIDADLLRRDLTVNAVALGLAGPRAGEVIAVAHALADLDAGRLRVLHPRSFRDDPTRLLRMVRYAVRLAFAPDPGTAELAAQAVEAGALGTVSGPRIGRELRLLAREDDPLAALAGTERHGIGEAIAPGFGVSERAVGARALALLDRWLELPDDGSAWLLALGLAFRGTAPELLRGRLERFGFPAEHRDRMLAVALDADGAAAALRRARTASQIARAAGGLPIEALALAAALGAEEPVAQWREMGRHVRLEIDGHDLIAAGIRPGWPLGRGLQAALAAKLDGRAASREAELAIALEAAREAAG